MSIKNWKICHLRFQAPLHLSKGKEGTYDSSADVLHSDTLKSALFAELKKVLRDDLDVDFLNQFKISSAFPFIQLNGTVTYFIPRPLIWNMPITLEGSTQKYQDKQLGKIAYLSLDLYRKLFVDKETVVLKSENISADGRFASLLSFKTGAAQKGKKIQIIFNQTTQHVHIPTDPTEDGNTFYVDQLRFHPDAGLYFWLELNSDDPQVFKKIELGLELLSDSGIGTDKNNGYGHFSFDSEKDIIATDKLEGFPDSSYEMALSLYCPQQEEVKDLEKSSYDLIKRGGFIASPENNRHLKIRKCSVFMFKEGSVFSKMEINREGKLLDLKPDLEGKTPADKKIPAVSHPIWRDGRALFFPIQIPTEL